MEFVDMAILEARRPPHDDRDGLAVPPDAVERLSAPTLLPDPVGDVTHRGGHDARRERQQRAWERLRDGWKVEGYDDGRIAIPNTKWNANVGRVDR